jgi:hydroxyacylglutathione hydrolase
MDKLRLLSVPAFSDNYIWLLADAAGNTLIVDPGEAAPVRAVLLREGLTPSAILLTHHHPDHIGGVAELLQEFPLPVYAPDDDRIPHATTTVRDGERISLNAPQIDFEVIAVPGHTSSHIAYYGGGLLFCGDTLFSLGCGRIFEGTAAQMLRSLQRLRALPGATQVCCGHEYTLTNAAFALTLEPDNIVLHEHATAVRALRERGLPSLPSTLSLECAANPFLRTDTSILSARIKAELANPDTDEVTRFAWLRDSKDQFKAPAA